MNYPIAKPAIPAALMLLFVLIVLGLAALGIAAYTAFLQVAPWYQAVFAAILIEAGLVVEAIAIVRRNWYAVPGAVISLVVSITYNYIQAQQNGKVHGLTDGWQLFTLALGPLAALFFAALTAGFELRRYEERVADWDTARNVWTLDQEQKQAAQVLEDQKHEEEQALKLKQMELDNIKAIELQKEKLRIREVRRSASGTKSAVSANGTNSRATARRGTYEEFAMTMAARNGTGPVSLEEAMTAWNISRRTYYRWLEKYEGALNEEPTHSTGQ